MSGYAAWGRPAEAHHPWPTWWRGKRLPIRSPSESGFASLSSALPTLSSESWKATAGPGDRGRGRRHDPRLRLMHTLDYPRWVLPTHWDDFDYPLDQPTVDWGGLVPLQEALAAASPKTTSSSWTIWRRSTVTMSAEACEDAEIRLGITRRMILVLV